MSVSQEVERLRLIDLEWDDEATREPEEIDQGAPVMLVKVTSGSGTTNKFFSCVPADLTGEEGDGKPGTIIDRTRTYFACNVGKTAPKVGDYLLITFLGRWTVRYD